MYLNHHWKTPGRATKAALPAGATLSQDVIASSGVTFQIWRLYQHAWLVCLLFPLIQVVSEPVSPWQVLVRGLSLLGFAAGYTWLMWPHPASQQTRAHAHSWWSFLLFGGLLLLVVVLSLVYGSAWLWLFIGMSALSGVLLPLRSAFVAVVLLTLFPLFLTLLVHGGIAGVDLWWLIAFLLLVRGIGLDMIGVARMGNAIRELHTARRELARLAVIEERMRLSRDLHDLLGQTLSVMTLKSELAGGWVQEEPERCAQELAEIERLSRQMLREVRKTVAGYRQVSLTNEVDAAQQLLEAVGIECLIEQTTEELPSAIDAALAWTVREGVTNVLRHSHARQCCIRLTRNRGEQESYCAEVINDGEGQAVVCQIRQGQPTEPGNGLSGLRERVTLLGGSMEAGVLAVSGSQCFRLRVTVPLQSRQEKARKEAERA